MNSQTPNSELSPSSSLTNEHRPKVETEIACWRCGEHLRGKALDYACPSCGSFVVESLFQTSFLGLSSSTFRRVHLGTSVILFSFLGSVALFVVSLLLALSVDRGTVLDSIDLGTVLLVPACGIGIGSWIASRDLLTLTDREIVAAARRLRIFATILPAILGAFVVINTQGAFEGKWLWVLPIAVVGNLVFLGWAFYALELMALTYTRIGKARAGSDVRLAVIALIVGSLFSPLLLIAIWPLFSFRNELKSLAKQPPSQRPGLAKWHLPASSQTLPVGFVCRGCQRPASARSPIDSWCVHCGTAFVESISGAPWPKAGILNPQSEETANVINATTGVLESETIRCSNCGYQLIGIAADDRCPECGLAVTASVINTTVVRVEVNINKASRGTGWIFVMLANTVTVVLFGTCYSDSGHDWTNLLNYLFFLIICGLCTLLQLTVFLPLSLRSVGNVLGGLRMLSSRPSASASPNPLESFADSLQFALFTAIVISTIACVGITLMGLGGNFGSQSPYNRAFGALVLLTFGWVAYVLPKATEWLVTLTNPRGSRGGVQHAFWPIFMFVALLWFVPGLPNVIRVLAGLGVGVMLCWQVLQFRRALAIAGGGSQSPQTEE